MEKIDAIFYINLAHRTDRQEAMTAMFETLNIPSEKIIRIDAVRIVENGAHGCIKSHIRALQSFLENPAFQTCIVLEDDFTFSTKYVESRLVSLFSCGLDWDIVSLAYNPRGGKFVDTAHHGFQKVLHHGTTSGYLLRRAFVPKLLENFQECDALMTKHGKQHFTCLDVHWYGLQACSKWFAFAPALGYQCEGYSDIENAHVNYKC